MYVSGILEKAAGSFKIDHPLDPANRYLSHSFVESPDMMNVYNGNAILDNNGEAVVVMEDWFEVLNRDFRYQLTCIGGFAPVYVAEKMDGLRFKIAGGEPGMEVSWQVTGIRNDPVANSFRIPVDHQKPPHEIGTFLHPHLYGKPPESSRDWKARIHRTDLDPDVVNVKSHIDEMRAKEAASARPAPVRGYDD